MRVWVLGNVHQACLDRLTPHLALVDGRGIPRAEVLAGIAEYEIILIRVEHLIDQEVIDRAERLRIIAVASSGTDHVDHGAAQARGIAIVSGAGGNAQSVAEFAIGQMINLARRSLEADRDVRNGIFDRQRYGGSELAGRTLGIIGLGQVGTRVARLGLAFGMQVVAYDPYIRYVYDPRLLGDGTPPVSLTGLDELLEQSDFVAVHVPLTSETRHMIDARRLAQMKPTAFLMNMGRGPVVAEADLADALTSGQIAGAAIDVFDPEPKHQSPLFGLSNCLVSPHMAGLTHDALERIGILTADRLLETVRRMRS